MSASLRWGVSRTDIGASVLVFATLLLVFRLPGSVVFMAVAPLLSLVATGVHRPPRTARLLWVFLGVTGVATTIGVLVDSTGLSLVNFMTLALTFTMFSVAVLFSGNPRRVAGAVIGALYWGFGCALVVGVLEIVAGFKLQTVLYPEASNLKFAGRLLVAAWFPNYNDFAIVVTMFAIMAMIRLLFDAEVSRATQARRALMFVVAAGLIVIGGSRGALLALLAGVAVVMVHAVRVVRPRIVSAPVVLAGIVGAMLVAGSLWFSPWVQDHSTSLRESIVSNTLQLMPDTSVQFWLGWGDIARFAGATAERYPGILMDPHNMILEVLIWFGLPSLVCWVALWLYVCWRGLWRVETATSWVGTAAVIVLALTPVLGVVPSSYMRYHYLFLLAPCAVAFLNLPVDRSAHR